MSFRVGRKEAEFSFVWKVAMTTVGRIEKHGWITANGHGRKGHDFTVIVGDVMGFVERRWNLVREVENDFVDATEGDAVVCCLGFVELEVDGGGVDFAWGNI